MRARRPTMKDVAREADVSRATVSLVMRDSDQIPEATKARVRRAMDDIGYVYNRTAGALRGSGQRSIGLVLTNISNPALAQLSTTLQRAVDDGDDSLLAAYSLGDTERERRQMTALAGHGVAGLIVMPAQSSQPTDLVAMQERLGVPIVAILVQTGAEVDQVLLDNHRAGYLVGEHLGTRGVTTAHLLGGYAETRELADRVAGITDGLQRTHPEARVRVHADTVRTYEARISRDLAQGVLAEGVPEALVAFNDGYALGIYQALRQARVEPGAQVAVASFDDTPMVAELSVPLTSVSLSPQQVGMSAFRLLRERLEQPDLPLQVEVVAPELRVRESTTRWSPPPADPRGSRTGA